MSDRTTEPELRSAKSDPSAGTDGTRLDVRYAGKTVLAIGAHPDDLELGVGGLLAKLSKKARVIMAIVSVPSDLHTRLKEAAKSAAILGCELEVLFPAACCRVEDVKTYALQETLEALSARLSPALVLSHGPSDFHRDHNLVFNACMAIPTFAASDLLCYHPTATRPVSTPFAPRAFVDITQTIQVKMDAIAVHESQFAARGLAIEIFREQARDHGRRAGVPYAEGLDVCRLLLN